MYDWHRKNRLHQKAGTNWQKPVQPSPTPAPPFGTLIEELRADSLSVTAASYEDKAAVSEFSVVASYSRPPRWTPLRKPYRLPQDSGEYFRDKNAARYPRHPMEPAIVAGLDASPQLGRQQKVDVVACSSTLGNLLRFVKGQDKSFRMVVEKVEGTVFFIRRENSPTELIPDVRGFGHTFPENYTTWDPDVKGSTCHQRLLRYSFGGLQFLVRFGADGYMEDTDRASMESSAPTRGKAPILVSELAASVDDAQISPKPSASKASVAIQAGGSLVDQSRIFDLKTRSFRKKDQDTIGEELPRLWVAQIPKLILAYHADGIFNDIHVLDVYEHVQEWERENKAMLSKLAALIHRITSLLYAGSSQKLELYHNGTGVLEIRKALPDVADALSPEVKAKWTARIEDTNGGLEGLGDDDITQWKEEPEDDYTACSGSCGYCGRCIYS
ncbi:hypothetical protein DL766_006340 [Monosporascus sp. MC13-8B]|uniref:Geranylgeranyl pyrophosphate synthetase n=1 Tax=Monosporascus cannonballus TaxID=155416 RepID=A0ABY0HDI3_9PEZI|nr:hypothetical protein DL762_003978 [Monosporascus cannonballus]RYO95127.1 hypothetical protein DL763_003825 [Monosporascus cannonballus]RYP27503.1 hypothetical protein DL766_006340 [Monosporascus sp. MC13-8B]